MEVLSGGLLIPKYKSQCRPLKVGSGSIPSAAGSYSPPCKGLCCWLEDTAGSIWGDLGVVGSIESAGQAGVASNPTLKIFLWRTLWSRARGPAGYVNRLGHWYTSVAPTPQVSAVAGVSPTDQEGKTWAQFPDTGLDAMVLEENGGAATLGHHSGAAWGAQSSPLGGVNVV